MKQSDCDTDSLQQEVAARIMSRLVAAASCIQMEHWSVRHYQYTNYSKVMPCSSIGAALCTYCCCGCCGCCQKLQQPLQAPVSRKRLLTFALVWCVSSLAAKPHTTSSPSCYRSNRHSAHGWEIHSCSHSHLSTTLPVATQLKVAPRNDALRSSSTCGTQSAGSTTALHPTATCPVHWASACCRGYGDTVDPHTAAGSTSASSWRLALATRCRRLPVSLQHGGGCVRCRRVPSGGVAGCVGRLHWSYTLV
jgi:hypothetical protein